MKKYLIFLISILSFSNEIYIDKIIYNGIEDSVAIKLNSNLKARTKLDIKDIDILVDNFKFASSNDINVNIEPSYKKGYVNIVAINKKRNPFLLSLALDNQGNSVDDGIYRYTIDTGLSGLILNENLNLSYTFVRPIKPKRIYNVIEELKPGEIMKPKEDKDELQKARVNNNINLELSFPLKTFKTYINYSYNNYIKSIIANKNIYDISGNSHRLELKEKIEIYRKKNEKVNLITKYTYTHRNSFLEDVKTSTDNIHNISLGAKYSNNDISLSAMFDNKIENMEYKPSFKLNGDYQINAKEIFNANISAMANIEKDNVFLESKINQNIYDIYTVLGLNTNIKETMPIIKLGIKKDLGYIYFDTLFNYDKELKWLFNVKAKLFK